MGIPGGPDFDTRITAAQALAAVSGSALFVIVVAVVMYCACVAARIRRDDEAPPSRCTPDETDENDIEDVNARVVEHPDGKYALGIDVRTPISVVCRR